MQQPRAFCETTHVALLSPPVRSVPLDLMLGGVIEPVHGELMRFTNAVHSLNFALDGLLLLQKMITVGVHLVGEISFAPANKFQPRIVHAQNCLIVVFASGYIEDWN